MNDPSCYEDWCDAVQARAAREDKISEAADLLREFLNHIESGYRGPTANVEKALAILRSTQDPTEKGKER